MRLKKKLIEILNDISGNVLVIGVEDETLKNVIDKNNNITVCNYLDAINLNNKNYIGFKGRLKKIQINKIRKAFKKKRVDYIICNYTEIEKHMRTFIKDSVYINKNTLYIYGDMDESQVIEKYNRYNTKIDVFKQKDGVILKVNNSLSKNIKIKDFFYSIKDNTIYYIDIIGDILTN